jgi:hypothetical protein
MKGDRDNEITRKMEKTRKMERREGRWGGRGDVKMGRWR